MRRTLAIRGTEAALSLVLLVTLTFLLAHAAPGGPAYAILGQKARPSGVGAVDLQLGLDVPLWRQYGIWWWHLLHGSLGNSYLLNRPVAVLLGFYLLNSVLLQGAGLLLGAALALVGGIVQGAFARRWPGRVLGGLGLALYAMPGFVIGAMLIVAFGGWLPPGGAVDLRLAVPGVGDRLAHLVLPAAAMALLAYAGLARVLAEGIDTELGLPYVRTAAAKGLRQRAIVLRHVLPNALRPVITLLGLSLPGLLAGSVAIESVFAYPGMGWLLWRSALSHDYPVLIGAVLLVGVATIVGNLAAEIAAAWLDPAGARG